nr:zinc finger protein 711-like [Halyomorpha halys]
MDIIRTEDSTMATSPEKNSEDPDANIHEKQNMDKAQTIFPCISCESIFQNREECREHMREHARSKTLKCRYCNDPQDSMKELLHHLKRHRAESKVCTAAKSRNAQKFPRKRKNPPTAMKSDAHILDPAIDRTEVEQSAAGRGRKVYSRACTDCGEVFLSTATLRSHRKLHLVGQLLYSCPYCIFRTDFPLALERHLKKKHEDLKIMYKCALCRYVAMKISLLKTHVTFNQHFDT